MLGQSKTNQIPKVQQNVELKFDKGIRIKKRWVDQYSVCEVMAKRIDLIIKE
jgi:hypothetical protein